VWLACQYVFDLSGPEQFVLFVGGQAVPTRHFRKKYYRITASADHSFGTCVTLPDHLGTCVGYRHAGLLALVNY
jgi:hypothetical protein